MIDFPAFIENFEKLEEAKPFPNSLHTTRELVVQRYLTWSAIGAQPDEEKEKIKGKVLEIVDADDNKKWVDEKESTFEWPISTVVDVLRRK